MTHEPFLDYLRTNQRGDQAVAMEARTHQVLKKSIGENPRQLGINDNITGCFYEVPFYGENYEEITVLDIILATDERFYLIEVKSNKKQIYGGED